MIHDSRFTTYDRGQGLLEAVIALGIIITGVVAALSLAVANLTAGVASESRIIAANLAREGVEVVRNIRDSHWVRGETWDDGLAAGDYVVRWDALTQQQALMPLPAASAEAKRLYRNSETSIMGADANAGSATPFFRTIVLEDIVCQSGDTTCTETGRIGIRVHAQVAWERRGVAPEKPQMEVITDLYKWR